MAATLNGTPVVVNWGTNANPAGQAISIPVGTTAVYFFWRAYNESNTGGLSSVTLAGNAPAQTVSINSTTGPPQAWAGCAAWYNPATGSQTLDPAWTVAVDSGPTSIVAFVTGGDTTAWRDADVDQATEGDACSVTLTTVAGDLVLKFDGRFEDPAVAPSLSGGWTSAQTHASNRFASRLSTISAAGASQACNSEDESYSTVVAIAIPAAAGAAADIQLPAVELGASASVERTVSASIGLPAVSLAAELSVARSVLAEMNLTVPQLAASISVFRAVAADIELPIVLLEASASSIVAAAVAIDVPSLELSGDVGIERSVSAEITLSVPALAAGLSVERTASGDIEITQIDLDADTARAGEISAAIELPAAELSASASIIRLASGDLAIAVPVLAASVFGEELTVSASLSLPAVELDADALVSRAVSGALQLNAIELSADAEMSKNVSAVLLLTAPTLDAQLAIERFVSGDMTLAELQMAAQTFAGAIQSVIGLRASVTKIGALEATVIPIGKKATLQ